MDENRKLALQLMSTDFELRERALSLSQEAEDKCSVPSSTDAVIDRAKRYLDFLLGKDDAVKAPSEHGVGGFRP